jgi:hypothetical protein
VTIEFHCPFCQKLLKTADDKAGVSATCPGCGEPVVVPSTAESAADAGSAVVGDEVAAGTSSADATRDCPMCGERIKAAATRCRYCGEALNSRGTSRAGSAPHRGGMILAFGIIGLLICLPFGIAAWVMGNNDLREIEAGRMDPAGAGLTRSGRILGIVACCFAVVGIVGNVLVVIAAIVAGK